MIPGGFTEIVSYFAGYLRLYEDIARDRDAPDGGPKGPPDQDYTVQHPVDDARPEFDDMELAAIRPPQPLPDQDDLHRGPPVKHLPAVDLDDDEPRFHPTPVLPSFLLAAGGSSGGGGGGGGEVVHKITVTYEAGGAQSEVEIRQVNHLVDNDNDIIGTKDIMISQSLTGQADHMLGLMVHQVNAVVPHEWKLPQDTQNVISAVGAHDQDWRNNPDTSDPHSVTPGYYLNGVLQQTAPDALNPDLQSVLKSSVDLPDTGHDRGQWADVGDNHTTNAARIFDAGSVAPTMIVLGDYFKTNAIFQVNDYANKDHIDASAGSHAVQTDPDQSTNAAGVVQHDSVFSSFTASHAGSQWHVDVVNGNYYDVHTLAQTNYLNDNDVVMQTSSDTHYSVVAGSNELSNVTEVLDGAFNYDLVIVGGSYHGLNSIYQYNVLVNNDTIKSALAGGAANNEDGTDPTQSISVGGNHLTNAATIDIYGNQNFDPINAGLQQVVDAIEGHVTNPDPALASLINSYNSTLHVLYVTGDYYDVNAIWQTNLVTDSNYVSQNLLPESPGAQVIYPNGNDAGAQSVTAGHDLLTNYASIVVAGADHTYVGGQTYGDMILIQANLLPYANDHTAQPSPQSLATELVAFLNDNEVHSADPQVNTMITTTATVNDDPMANMMH